MKETKSIIEKWMETPEYKEMRDSVVEKIAKRMSRMAIFRKAFGKRTPGQQPTIHFSKNILYRTFEKKKVRYDLSSKPIKLKIIHILILGKDIRIMAKGISTAIKGSSPDGVRKAIEEINKEAVEKLTLDKNLISGRGGYHFNFSVKKK